MIDNCYIDGISICNRFGVWVTKGGYNGLLAFPAMKEPESNDWPEEDGIEVDLSDPKLEPKEATISFLSTRTTGRPTSLPTCPDRVAIRFASLPWGANGGSGCRPIRQTRSIRCRPPSA